MKIIWPLETDKSRFKFSLCLLLAMWLWISQLMYLNLITDLRSFAVKIKWGNANKAHRTVPGIQEAPSVIFYEFSNFLISWSIWLDFFPPWSPLGSPSLSTQSIFSKRDRIFSDSETTMFTMLFKIKVGTVETLGLKSKTQSTYSEPNLKDTSLLYVWSVYNVTLTEP